MAIVTATSPIDGQALGEFETHNLGQIREKMQSARKAARAWAAISVKQRSKILGQFGRILLAEIDSICNIISRTTGKVMTEALLGEIYPVLDLARYYERHASRILRAKGVITSPFGFPGATAEIARQPYGVVAIISPWNYPFQITVSQILSALFAGNAVIFKLSELSLPLAALIIGLFSRLDLPEHLVQSVTGDGGTGEHLIDAGPDMIVFTGSLNTGRSVMQRAAQHPVPVILELGGKDAMIVFADADLQRACDGALYGAFSNSGQACVAVERLYIQQDCHEHFLRLLCEAAEKLKAGRGAEGDMGAMTSPQQMEIVRRHYENAISKGAKASGPLELEGHYFRPVILWDITPDMLVMREETFGPLLPVLPFTSEEEAVQLANSTEFGLNASIWSRDIAKAQRVAGQLQIGNWSINDVLKNVGHAGLPFGGVKKSGFGRYHGAEGLLNFTYSVSGLTSRSHLPAEPNWFPYSKTRYLEFKGYLDFIYGSGSVIGRIQPQLESLAGIPAIFGL